MGCSSSSPAAGLNPVPPSAQPGPSGQEPAAPVGEQKQRARGVAFERLSSTEPGALSVDSRARIDGKRGRSFTASGHHLGAVGVTAAWLLDFALRRVEDRSWTTDEVVRSIIIPATEASEAKRYVDCIEASNLTMAQYFVS
jgi:hypothetical protein